VHCEERNVRERRGRESEGKPLRAVCVRVCVHVCVCVYVRVRVRVCACRLGKEWGPVFPGFELEMHV